MKKILMVDDEPAILAVMELAMRPHFPIETAGSPRAGLEALKHSEDFSVVVSDMRMPEMSGVDFLAKVKQMAPDLVRVMLTANVDQETAIQAVNKGSIFRFLNKPCTPENLRDTLAASVRQYELLHVERDLLENTVKGSVRILTEILAQADPLAFGQAERVRRYMRDLAQALNHEQTWELEVAALLSRIGSATIPAELTAKSRTSQKLSEEEARILRQIPQISGRLLAGVERFENISKTLTFQTKHFDGSGDPPVEIAGGQIPEGARMLKFLSDLVELEAQGKLRTAALRELATRTGWYDPRIVEAFTGIALPNPSPTVARPPVGVPLTALRVGQITAADVHTKDGTLIVGAGHRISPTLLERLRNFDALSGVKEPILVQSQMA